MVLVRLSNDKTILFNDLIKHLNDLSILFTGINKLSNDLAKHFNCLIKGPNDLAILFTG